MLAHQALMRFDMFRIQSPSAFHRPLVAGLGGAMEILVMFSNVCRVSLQMVAQRWQLG